MVREKQNELLSSQAPPLDRRKASPPRRASVVNEMDDYIDSRLNERSLTDREHFDARMDDLTTLIKSGFPDGDMDTHRRVHEAYIAEAAGRKKFREAVIEKTVGGLIWAALIGLGTLLMLGVGDWLTALKKH